MSNLLKKPYEISIWEDVLTFIGKSGTLYTKIDESVTEPIIAQFYDERKVCVIGSDTMDSPIRAVQPKLVSGTNGSNILTFTLYYKYQDDESEEILDNPYVKFLTNEKKVKLRYGAIDAPDCRWYDLIIKNIEENSESKAFEYTAKDQFVNELSKSGFDIEFATELENNMGNIKQLAGTVLEGSDWSLADDCAVLLQYKEEPLYKVKLKSNITGTDMLTGESSPVIQAGKYIYIFYSHLINKDPSIQFLYTKDEYKINDDRVITNAPASSTSEKGSNYLLNQSFSYTETDQGNIPSFAQTIELISEYRGARLVRKAKTVYDKLTEQYVNTYKKGGEEYYGFSKNEYVSPLAVNNYITNSKDFTEETGWLPGRISGQDNSYPELEARPFPDIFDFSKEFESTLRLNFTTLNQVIVNSGVMDNRSAIDHFAENDEYIFRMELKTQNGEVLEPCNPKPKLNIKISEYTLDDGLYIFNSDDVIFDFSTPTWQRQEVVEEYYDLRGNLATRTRVFYYAKAICKKSMSYSDLILKKIGIFFQPESNNDINSTLYLIEAQLFPCLQGEGQDRPVFPGELQEAKVRTLYYYYPKNNSYKTAEDIKYSYVGATKPEEYILVYGDEENESESTMEGYEKIRSITASESNRFNLLQTLCETFECWLDVRIQHESTGKIKTKFIYETELGNGDYVIEESDSFITNDHMRCLGKRQQKEIAFKDFIGQDNFIGFKYGINLKGIKRTLDSDGIVSKIIVKDNSNEFAKDGFCSISRAKENPTKENFVHDFTYYINQGLLKLTTVTNDLYSSGFNGYLGYYTKLSRINSDREALIEEQSKILLELVKNESDYKIYSSAAHTANEQMESKKRELKQMTGYDYADFISPSITNQDLLDWQKQDSVVTLCTSIAVLDRKQESYSNLSKQLEDAKKILENRQQEIEEILKLKVVEKERLNKEFYHKYSRFIQEGSWISEDYLDDELYYLDAESTLHTSSQPKVSYDIKVLEISQIEGYENYIFALGDKTFIEDTEFFGWFIDPNNNFRTPYKEEVIVSEITVYLDSPESNQIKVQNYKTQFEDLFQRIAATTQAIEYSTGKYDKVSNVITTSGTIDAGTLQNSIANNAIILENAKDQTVIWDETGITTMSPSRPNEIVRIVSGGIMLSKDGGETWTTGITGSGINANYITTGQLDTNVIRILNGVHTSFKWDNLGLTAYKFDPIYDGEGNITGGKNFKVGIFTRFDQYGLYGIDGQEDFDASKKSENGLVGEEKIWDTAKFALTWNGFSLKTNDRGGYIRISSENDIEVLVNENPRIKIGDLSSGTGNRFGLRILDADQKTVMETDDRGLLYLEKYMRVGPDSTDSTRDRVKFGVVQNYTIESENDLSKILSIKDSDSKMVKADSFNLEEDEVLSIYDDGTILAKRIIINGGRVGNMTIEEIENLNLKVEIEIVQGNDTIFRNSADSDFKTLRASLTDGEKELDFEGKKELSYQWTIDGEYFGNTQIIDVLAADIKSNTGAALVRCYITVSDKESGQSVTF